MFHQGYFITLRILSELRCSVYFRARIHFGACSAPKPATRSVQLHQTTATKDGAQIERYLQCRVGPVNKTIFARVNCCMDMLLYIATRTTHGHGRRG